jgi:L-alanine-DL-glutamate epimerase-like enolase superfamily enzyme
VREAVGDAFEIMVDANQCFTVSEAIRRAGRSSPSASRGSRSRCRQRISRPRELAAHTSIPIAVGESIYHPAHFREYLERDACSIVQVDVRADRRHHPWLKVAPFGRGVQRRRVPAFPDGAARIA